MMDFESAALDFFVANFISAEKQVTMVIPDIKDLKIHNCITAAHVCTITLYLAKFISELCSNYFQQDWEDQVHNDILTLTLAMSGASFWNWYQHLLKLNCLLCGTSSAFDNSALHNHLEAHLDNELKSHLRNTKPRRTKTSKHGLLQSVSWMKLGLLKTSVNMNYSRKPTTDSPNGRTPKPTPYVSLHLVPILLYHLLGVP